MLRFFELLVLFSVQNALVKCVIPTLSVQRLDRNAIQRKREDTLQMCRMFNAENENEKRRQNQLPPEKNLFTLNKQNKGMRSNTLNKYNKYSRRVKRDIGVDQSFANPSLDFDDAKRVEKIVDKLYDDNDMDGKKATYRKKDFRSLTSKKPSKKAKNSVNISDPALKSGRRFLNFRPAQLLGPLNRPEDYSPLIPDATSHIPWPKLWSHGIIPYFIDPKTYDSELTEVITKAFDYFEKVTCIRLQKLREKPRDKMSMEAVEWVYITNPSGLKQCVHSNERKINKGVQMVVFGYDCMSLGEIVHEIMHVLGFPHEHTRPDRDNHITVMWDNIKPGYKKYFELRKSDVLMSLNLPYDHASVLHYPARAFSKNGQMTLVSEQGVRLGQREALSETDVAKVSLIYGAECVNRNKQYLLTTCPSVVKAHEEQVNVTQDEIEDYFHERLWPFGIINYKLRDALEFSAEEKENILAVIRHIEKETCIEFRDLTNENKDADTDDSAESKTGNDDAQPHHLTEKSIIDQSSTENLDEKGNKSSGAGTTKPQSVVPKDDSSSTSVEDFPPPPPRPPGLQTSSDEEFKNKPLHEKEVSPKEDTDPKNNEIDSQGPKNHVLVATETLPESVVSTKDDVSDKVQARVKRAATYKLPGRPLSPHRRHAGSILVLTRSSRSGCVCPKPGRIDGNQPLEITKDCFNSVNDLLHVFVHVLGLDHQHNMHDRDNYLHIFWSNMTDEVKSEFQKKLPPAASVGFPYDYLSVTHYPWLEIKNGNINLMYPIWNDGWAMGHWQGLSSTDVQKLNLLYFDQCMERKKHV